MNMYVLSLKRADPRKQQTIEEETQWMRRNRKPIKSFRVEQNYEM